ncbi:hypothetical protein BDV34DRAFT_67357 [Aspergillus parasiticus]|uniref:Uncharacterized protein n=1 Tax=Aspergillus parasiticus TaxID=5067 RepID=A0A5N6DR07_ASPPA|nr:hypothetical protein BDV34DRAFT_67357 [Aspergillus parasiticus]
MEMDKQDSHTGDPTSYQALSPDGSEIHHQSDQDRSWSSKVNDYWVWEVLFCVGSLIALVAVIVVLRIYDGSPLPEWPYGITINSVLSWITQVFTSCIVGVAAPCVSQSKWIYFSTGPRQLSEMDTYDWASRGPLGCMALMWSSRMRRVASIGAIIMILSIGVGPFVQQMVTVRDQLVPSQTTASVSRADSYNVTATHDGTNSGWEINKESIAIYNAVLEKPNTDAPLKPNCPTGNCEFPPFRSLAVCSHCSDISHLLDASSGKIPCYTTYSQYNYSLPTGLQLNITTIKSDGFSFDREGNGYAATSVSDWIGFEESLPKSNGFWLNTILNITSIRVAKPSNLSAATASRCSLYWCVKTFSSGMESGRAYEKTLDTHYDAEPTYPVTFRLPASHNLTAANLTAANLTVYDDALRLNDWMADKFNFTTGQNISCLTPSGDSEINVALEKVTGGAPTEFTQPFVESETHDLFEKVADGLTTHIRTATSAAHTRGRSWSLETQIHVRWAWIALPVLLIILAILFLCWVALQSKQRRLDLWKSSSLPFLYISELDPKVQQDMRILGDPAKISTFSQEVSALLMKEDIPNATWKLHSGDRISCES